MSESTVDDIVALLPPLLTSIDALAFVARYLNPPDYEAVLDAAGTPDVSLRAARAKLGEWPERLAHVRTALETASEAALAAFDGLRGAAEQPEGLRAAYRA